MKSSHSISIISLMLLCVAIVQSADIAFTITISDVGGNAQSLIFDFADATGWTALVSNGMGGTISNPLTRPQYAKKRIEDEIRETVKAYRAQKQADATRTKTISDTDAIIVFK